MGATYCTRETTQGGGDGIDHQPQSGKVTRKKLIIRLLARKKPSKKNMTCRKYNNLIRREMPRKWQEINHTLKDLNC